MGVGVGPDEVPESPAEQTANIQLLRCATCGHIAEPGSRFCSSCGASLAEATGAEDTGVLDAAVDTDKDSSVDPAVLNELGPSDAVLVVFKGPDEGARFPLTGSNVTVGRSPDAVIFLDDVTVSRRHADFNQRDGKWELVDAGSLNGTYVNRNRIDRTVLNNGDELQIGKYRFVFHQGPDA